LAIVFTGVAEGEFFGHDRVREAPLDIRRDVAPLLSPLPAAGCNKYRLVTRILYRSQKVYILKVMTHQEYDDRKWKEQCGCFAAPPGRQK
jgi:hypothetical protein